MRGLAPGLVLAVVLGFAPSLASAQPVSVSDKPGWTPEGYLLSFGVGAYRPDPGSETFDLVYPGDNGPILLIVSRHELEGTPDDLIAMDEEVREVLYEGDVIKLVTHARSTEDGLRMLRHLREARGGLIAFASGSGKDPAPSFSISGPSSQRQI